MKKSNCMTRPNEWGTWYEGERFDVRLGESYYLNNNWTRTRVDVEIRDRSTGETVHRVGEGRQLGNFFPITVNWKGEKVDVEKLLR